MLLAEYGGKCQVPLGESPEEKQLLEIIEKALDEHDLEFEEIVPVGFKRVSSHMNLAATTSSR